MITKNKTSIGFAGLYLLVLPIACILLFAFSDRPAGKSLFVGVNAAHAGLTIIVDPGHGGSDLGTNSGANLTEKDLTLAIAKQMQKIGISDGVNVILTRTGDETISLEKRIFSAKGSDARIFISLHVNSSKDASESGIECVVSENNVDFDASRIFGEQLLGTLQSIEGIKTKGVMKSNFFILRQNAIPAVLLELGYLSNNGDRAFLSKVENQQALAQAIMSASTEHLK